MAMKRKEQAPSPSGVNWRNDVYTEEEEDYGVCYPPYKSRRTLTRPDGTIATEEREHQPIIKANTTAVKEIKTGSDLNTFNYGKAVSLHKDQLPENALMFVKQLNKVELKGEQSAIYMTAMLLMQTILIKSNKTSTKTVPNLSENESINLTEADAEFDINKDDETDIEIIDSDFRDYSGAVVTQLIKCTAPPSVAKAYLSGALTDETIKDGMLIMINESYDRFHPANLIQKMVHLNYQYYMPCEIPEKLRVGLVNENAQLEDIREFFMTCLSVSANFKDQNEKFLDHFEKTKNRNNVNVGAQSSRVNRAIMRSKIFK